MTARTDNPGEARMAETENLSAGETPPDAEQIAYDALTQVTTQPGKWSLADIPRAVVAALREAGYLTTPNAGGDVTERPDRSGRAPGTGRDGPSPDESASSPAPGRGDCGYCSGGPAINPDCPWHGGLAVGSDVPTSDALIEQVVAWHEQRFPNATPEVVALKLAEECGELASAVIGHVGLNSATGGGSVQDEAADVLIVLYVLLGRWWPTDLHERVRAKLDVLTDPASTHRSALAAVAASAPKET